MLMLCQEQIGLDCSAVLCRGVNNGDDIEILAKRKVVYLAAKKRNSQRWSGEIRNWNHVNDVLLNPDKQITEKTTYVCGGIIFNKGDNFLEIYRWKTSSMEFWKSANLKYVVWLTLTKDIKAIISYN